MRVGRLPPSLSLLLWISGWEARRLQGVQGRSSARAFFGRSGTENMMLSAIYPEKLGEAVATVHRWLATNCLEPVVAVYAAELAETLPTAHEALSMAKEHAEAYKWKDSDPGFPGLEGLLATPLPRAQVRLALRKRKLALQSAKKPFPISDTDEDSAGCVQHSASSDGGQASGRIMVWVVACGSLSASERYDARALKWTCQGLRYHHLCKFLLTGWEAMENDNGASSAPVPQLEQDAIPPGQGLAI